MSDEHEDERPDRSPWMICPCCEGEGKSSAYLGDFTMSEFNEAFDDENSRAAYFRGDYDRPCNVCGGTGKIRESQMGLVERQREDDLIARTGRNSAGEPC